MQVILLEAPEALERYAGLLLEKGKAVVFA
jgi:hypothetical protein